MWGAWLVSLGGYLIVTLKFTGSEVGAIFGTMGIAALFMPAILGVVADRWINAERVLGLCHLLGAVFLWLASNTTDFHTMYTLMLLNAMVYMPTIALSYAVSYTILEKRGFDIVSVFPPIRVWGTVGFIVAMWSVDLLGYSLSSMQLKLSSVLSLVLGFYSFTLPACPPSRIKQGNSLVTLLGLDAFVLFKERQMQVFFIFAMLLGASLQITNTFGEPFLHDFAGAYPNSFAVKHPGLLMSLSQVSETLLILAIPFFLRKFEIKGVMLISIFAWVLRFGFFAIGNPEGGLIWLVLSMIVYGMAFDFFNISGSMFVKQKAPPGMASSAQGVFMLMTNGIGAYLGSRLSGMVIDYFTHDGVRDWPSSWLSFAAYMVILGLVFPFVFKHERIATHGASRES